MRKNEVSGLQEQFLVFLDLFFMLIPDFSVPLKPFFTHQVILKI